MSMVSEISIKIRGIPRPRDGDLDPQLGNQEPRSLPTSMAWNILIKIRGIPNPRDGRLNPE